jgi:hypothetical protein
VLLVQLSDSHLFAEADGRLLGMDTADSLRQVVRLVLDEQPGVDLLLATGDSRRMARRSRTSASVRSPRRFPLLRAGSPATMTCSRCARSASVLTCSIR